MCVCHLRYHNLTLKGICILLHINIMVKKYEGVEQGISFNFGVGFMVITCNFYIEDLHIYVFNQVASRQCCGQGAFES